MGYILPIQRENPLVRQPNLKKPNKEKIQGPFPVVLQLKYEENEQKQKEQQKKKQTEIDLKKKQQKHHQFIAEEGKGLFIHEKV